MNPEYASLSKRIRRQLCELAGDAYDAELTPHQEELFAGFAAWKRGEITARELDVRIHRYHQGPSRTVANEQSRLKPDILVARAVAMGLLDEDTIEDDVLETLRPMIDTLRGLMELDE